MTMIKKVLGYYFCELNAETFTKPPKSANSTSELHLAKGSRLYQEMTKFYVFFRVEGCCNNKPTLNSVDGGIGRRVRIIHYPVKFIDNPDPDNNIKHY